MPGDAAAVPRWPLGLPTRLRPVELPSALLWGADERILSVDQVEDYRALLPLAQVRTVPGWGHFPMIEQPAAYAFEIAALACSLTPAPWQGPTR